MHALVQIHLDYCHMPSGVRTEWNMVMHHLTCFKKKILLHQHSSPLCTVNHAKWQCALLSNGIANRSDKQDIIWRMGSLKCALLLKATVNLVLSYPSPYLLSSYLITLHLQLLSFIHILILCVSLCLCMCACVRVLPRGACSLIEFFSHRSVWQVALLASSVCSEQVLSWVRSCHIHLHKGTISQSHFLYTKLPSTFFQKQTTFTVSPFQIHNSTPSLSSMQAHIGT